jgi:hypothetical protein
MCVEVWHFLEPRRLNHPILLIVPAVKFWHAIVGLYVWVFTFSRKLRNLTPVQLGLLHDP